MLNIRHLNAGLMVGPAWAITDLLAITYQGDCCDDQRNIARAFLSNLSFIPFSKSNLQNLNNNMQRKLYRHQIQNEIQDHNVTTMYESDKSFDGGNNFMSITEDEISKHLISEGATTIYERSEELNISNDHSFPDYRLIMDKFYQPSQNQYFPHSNRKSYLTIDYANSIFLQLSGHSNLEDIILFEHKDNHLHLVNKFSRSEPCFFHENGKKNGKMKHLLNIFRSEIRNITDTVNEDVFDPWRIEEIVKQ